MTDLQAQAAAYAGMIMMRVEDGKRTFSREEMYRALAVGYEQGYTDRCTSRRVLTVGTEDGTGYKNPGSDCVFHYEGNCTKGLFPPCVREGCGGYIPKSWHEPKNG